MQITITGTYRNYYGNERSTAEIAAGVLRNEFQWDGQATRLRCARFSCLRDVQGWRHGGGTTRLPDARYLLCTVKGKESYVLLSTGNVYEAFGGI